MEYFIIPLISISKIDKLIEVENTIVVARGWGQGGDEEQSQLLLSCAPLSCVLSMRKEVPACETCALTFPHIKGREHGLRVISKHIVSHGSFSTSEI